MPARSTTAAQDRGGQVVGPDARQGAAVAADRGPDGLDDPGFAEGAVEIACHAADGSGAVGQAPARTSAIRGTVGADAVDDVGR